MQNMVDPNLLQQEGQGVALNPNGAETVILNSNSDESHRDAVPPSTGRCPYHAMLEELDLWQGQEP
jgi:hypothetical protein